jgi:parallel beta-helix repeat protein
LYDASVSAVPGEADFLLPSAAFTSGAKTVFVYEGVYNEPAGITMPAGGKLIGEGAGVVINFPAGAGNGIVADATGSSFACTVTVTNLSATIAQTAGTAFGASDVGRYIQIGVEFYKIVSVVNGVSVDIDRVFRGATRTGYVTKRLSMDTGLRLENLILRGANSGTGILIDLIGQLHATVERVLVELGGTVGNIRMTDCGQCALEKVVSYYPAGGYCIGLISSAAIKGHHCVVAGGGTQGINVSTSDGCTFSECFASDCFIEGMDVNSSSDINFSDCQVTGNKSVGIAANVTSTNVVISNCIARDNGGIDITNASEGGVVEGCSIGSPLSGSGDLNIGNNGRVIGNTLTDGASIFTLGSDNVLIQGNTVTGGTISVNGENHRITDNKVIDTPIHGINITGGNNCTVDSNDIMGALSSAISITSGDGHSIHNNNLSGNFKDYNFAVGITNYKYEGRTYNDIQTTDATPTIITTLDLNIPSGQSRRQFAFEVVVSAMESGSASYGTWKKTLVARKISGTSTIAIFNADLTEQTGLAAGSVTAAVNGSDQIEISITGNVGETIEWTCQNESYPINRT